jgi:peptide/nickel transport system substrate-binding protein
MRRNDILRAAAVVSIAIGLLAGCSKAASTGAQNGLGSNSWTQPGVLRFSENQDISSLDPIVNGNATTNDLSMFIYSYAVRYNDKGQPVPDAVTELPTQANGDVSKDGLTLKYKLRHDITFQDGVKLTCKDLKFTWQVVMNPKTNVAATDGYSAIKDIDCSNPYVAVVHMKRLYAPYLQTLWSVNGNAPILPEHLLAKYNDNLGTFNHAAYNSMPIGSGPFKVVEWSRGDEVRMEAYPGYFLGRPKLNEVVFKIMPDENTMVTEVQTHGIDMAARGTAILWPRYEALAADPKEGLRAVQLDSFVYDHIDFNLATGALPIRGIQVRRAIAYATNKQEIIDKIFHGAAIPAETDQQPTLSWARTTDFVHYPFDPQKAEQLLDADGWKVGPDGIRVKNGQRLEFQINTLTEATNDKAEQVLLQSQWHAVGIQADVKNYPTATMFQNGSAGILEGGHYDVALFAWVGAADPDDSPLYASDNFAPHGQNSLFWKNPKVDAAEADALSTLDLKRRKADYLIIQQQVMLDVPTIVLSFRKVIYDYNTDLKGFAPSPVISPFWNPWEYSI